MFREHDDHFQPSFFDVDNLMTERSKKRLEKSWAVPFYRDVFCNIDESKFRPLFSHTGAPSTPVNILVSLELFKYMFGWSDDQLMDEYDFNYLVNHAVGNRQIGLRPIAEKTLYNYRARVFQYLAHHPEEEGPVENLGDLERLRLLIDHLPDEGLLTMLQKKRSKGRDDYPVVAMWHAVLAGVVFQHASASSLVRELSRNAQLRFICGFKLHLVVDATYELPVAWSVTKANVSDNTEGKDLVSEMMRDKEWLSGAAEYLMPNGMSLKSCAPRKQRGFRVIVQKTARSNPVFESSVHLMNGSSLRLTGPVINGNASTTCVPVWNGSTADWIAGTVLRFIPSEASGR